MAPQPSRPQRNVWDQARDSISRASSELSLLASAAGSVGQPVADGTRNALKATAGGYFRLQQCCGDAIADMLQAMSCVPGSEDVDDGEQYGHKETPLSNALFLFFVAQIILLLYLAFVLVYMPFANISWFSPLSLFFHWCVSLCTACYARGCATDPGGVPHTPEWLDGTAKTHERKKESGERRFCEKERIYKPDRAHFSHLLNRNVLRMDHHCPWLNNTMGHRNYKYFFLFIFYATIVTDTMASLILHLLLHESPAAGMSFFLWETEILTALLGFVLTPFSLFHMWLISRNMTTIEYCETQRSGTMPQHMYDVGCYQNWREIMGHPLTWLLPVGGPEGDGLHFPLHPDFRDDDADKDGSPSSAVVAFAKERSDDFTTGCCVVGSTLAGYFSFLQDCF